MKSTRSSNKIISSEAMEATQLADNLDSLTPSQTPASDKLLGTTELLEMTLLQTPMRDLLLSQRVCKTWKQTIADSPSLQRKLFFLPVQGEPARLCKRSPPNVAFTFFNFNEADVAQLLSDDLSERSNIRQSYHQALSNCSAVSALEYIWTQNSLPVDIYANPMLKALQAHIDLGGMSSYELKSESNGQNTQYERKDHTMPRSEIWEQPSASWRRMLMTQPPIDKTYLHFRVFDLRFPESVLSGVPQVWARSLWKQQGPEPGTLGSWVDQLQKDYRKTWGEKGKAVKRFLKQAPEISLIGFGMVLWKYDEDAGWARKGELKDGYWLKPPLARIDPLATPFIPMLPDFFN